MQQTAVVFVSFLLLGWTTAAQTTVHLEKFASGLNFPVALSNAPGISESLFVVEQKGRIRTIRRGDVLPDPFIDISQRVRCCGENGLLSVAFHPDFLVTGQFFLDYVDGDGATVISRFRVFASDHMRGDPESEEIVLRIQQPYSNHNGGELQFGPDGYLYIGMGDGGSANDPENRAQNPQELLGKLLRIDVDGGTPYLIPPTNPFHNSLTVSPEIWALGLRNPWRFSFDSLTGDLFIADVGQNHFEEVNLQLATSHGGENYGWRLMEGSSCNLPPSGCSSGGLTMPILEYSHDSTERHCSVTGGYVYRGRWSDLHGTYFYGDYCSGFIWGARQISGTWRNVIEIDSPLFISSFGEDSAGEIYVVDHGGQVFRIVGESPPRKRPVRR